MKNAPFYLYKRKESPYWFVRYTLKDGGIIAKSTRQADETAARETAVSWLVSGEYALSAKKARQTSFKNKLRTAEIDSEDLIFVLEELKRRNVISKVIIKDTPAAVNALSFARKFWNWEESPYIAEKLRQNHSIHLTHVINMSKFINRYWAPYIEHKELGEISRKDIEAFIDDLSKLQLAPHTKNQIIRSFTTALKWASNHEIIDKDVSQGIVYFSGAYKERIILTPELAHAVFLVEWKDERARLANMVAMLTGMRSGEIRGLQLKDLGRECIYVRHSWNDDEGLKCPKNGEERTVQFPFPEIIKQLKALYWKNPHAEGIEEFIFWASIPHKPIDADIFVEGLRSALVCTGLSAESAKAYTFHAWRHFFTTYMSEKVDTKLLQMQTGHKTKAMLEHYAAHKTETDFTVIREAQKKVFSALIE